MKRTLIILLAAVLGIIGLSLAQSDSSDAMTEGYDVAYFAGGCFWCVESDFEKHDGISEVISGYMGGEIMNPTYKQVASGQSGHREIVEVQYDASVISYQELLDIFWRLHDPSDADGSFVDRGFQYGSAIYYTTNEERVLAEGAIEALLTSGKFESIATSVEPAAEFYIAEDYHQDYHTKNPLRYNFYRSNSGRDRFIKRVWKGDDLVYQLEENLVQN